ncbi:SCO1664 family protein [Arthrobacter agilis]|uniref:SCO1664 family protein n=1 Tax=Arthrobacter agilis TaxID=37921 RepID=UPI0023665599|nr:SCO1664 family protein [Arthrobacter agilis]WDF31846.1 SCO1664 family protein [Arthrobacter agilis]
MPPPDLISAELTLTGRITTASNATFLGSIDGQAVVYKPIRGEKPLWDFPDGSLAHREVAAYLVSETLGWNIVPRTWLRDGPFGEGMVQLWQEQDPAQRAVDLVTADEVPGTGWKHVLEGQDQSGRTVVLLHEDSPALRRMAVFDVVVNNADRKGDHILTLQGGHRYGVDHGITFHEDHKLRTVLWGWVGDPLTAEELEGVERVLHGLEAELGRALTGLITADELAALSARCTALCASGRFPAPSGEMSAVPWPLF